jgi:hypothetical protein
MWRAVLVSALVFGAFHLSFETAIRFLPTAWLGLVLGYVVWHTRSIFTGMLMHLVNNATVVLLLSTPPSASASSTPPASRPGSSSRSPRLPRREGSAVKIPAMEPVHGD